MIPLIEQIEAAHAARPLVKQRVPEWELPQAEGQPEPEKVYVYWRELVQAELDEVGTIAGVEASGSLWNVYLVIHKLTNENGTPLFTREHAKRLGKAGHPSTINRLARLINQVPTVADMEKNSGPTQ